MQMKRVRRAWLFPLLSAVAGTALLAACDRQEAPPKGAAARPAAPAAPPSPVPVAAVPGPEEGSAPDGGQSAEAIVPAGEWTEGRMYKFRLERVEACGSPTEALGPAQQPAAGGVGRFRGETSWVGALFSVEAKDPSMFVSPRDLELRRGGVILSARHINQPLLPRCKPLLPAKQLRVGESLSGFALFEVPKDFRTKTEDPIVLSYRPTRWGGARRVEVPLRECLDACPESSVSKPPKTAGRIGQGSRSKH